MAEDTPSQALREVVDEKVAGRLPGRMQSATTCKSNDEHRHQYYAKCIMQRNQDQNTTYGIMGGCTSMFRERQHDARPINDADSVVILCIVPFLCCYLFYIIFIIIFRFKYFSLRISILYDLFLSQFINVLLYIVLIVYLSFI